MIAISIDLSDELAQRVLPQLSLLKEGVIEHD